eukprot:INCI16281.1.p1 GENE.INCI16281.1~~INCI16281.1.p1  ORF type:complete len:564 (-),score=106.74 INCI16281.1:52-1743(-)
MLLGAQGYKIVPVNPGSATDDTGETILGEHVYASLADIPFPVDMVDVFRPAVVCPGIAAEAVAIGAKVLWLQLGIVSNEAEEIARLAGLNVVMDRCPKIEFSRLFGELGWHGFNSEVISSRRIGSKPQAAQSLNFSGFDTKAIHAGARPCASTGARATPIFQTSSFVFEDADHAASLFNLQTFGNVYARLSNPTTAVLEERLATLEGGRGATCTSSGHAAQMLALFALMEPGNRLVASDKLYGGSITQFGKTIKKFGWDCTFVDVDDHDAVAEAASDPACRAVWCESLANPGGSISDISALAAICDDVGVPLIVDNTLATPALCRPIEHGASLVVHSTTKFLSGHGNALGGVVIDSGKFNWATQTADGEPKFPSLATPEPAYHGINFFESFGDLAFTIFGHAVALRDLGPTMAPMNAFLTIMGIETLALRMRQHTENALRLAEWLEDHEKVTWVSHAGLSHSPYAALQQEYLPDGAGSVFTFGVEGGYEAGVKVVENCQLFSHLANVGDTRSLILHPASTTHRQLTEEQREAAGAGDDTLRLSVGLESLDDLILDLEEALRCI